MNLVPLGPSSFLIKMYIKQPVGLLKHAYRLQKEIIINMISFPVYTFIKNENLYSTKLHRCDYRHYSIFKKG